MTRWLMLVTLALVATVAETAADEQRLFALFNTFENQQPVATLLEVSLIGGRVVGVAARASVPGRAADSQFDVANGAIAVVAGGRFVVWRQFDAVSSEQSLVVFDRSTGQYSLIPGLPEGLGVTDPTLPRLFVPHQGQIAMLSAAGRTLLPNTAGLFPRAISRDGSRLYAIRAETGSGFGVSEFVVVDSATGQLQRTVSLPSRVSRLPEIAVADDESTVWLWTETIGVAMPIERTLRRFDVATGSQTLVVPLESAPNTEAIFGGLFVDSVGLRVGIASAAISGIFRQITFGNIRFFDAVTGAEVRRIDVEGTTVLHFDRSSRTVLAFSQSEYPFPGPRFCSQPTVRAIPPQPGIAPIVTRAQSSTCFVSFFASAPAAPQLHAPVVSANRTVTLTWTLPLEATTGSVIEAGSASGEADLIIVTVTGSAFTAANVPAGTYFVRVRARNEIGVGAASNEVQVVLP